jgi:hypothetical protein
MASCVRSHLHGQKWFPNVDEKEGEVYLMEGRGRELVSKCKYLHGQTIASHIKIL